ncbi:MAG TPA: DUF2254 domain-containing protein [Candidatus Limnocylindrales bacterium]|nr:DUF2254 domain-containing protein [Candidatus Limnocylindrales bacterium]
MSRRRHYWTLLRASFWFVPGVMAVAYGALAAGLLVIDSSLAPAFEDSIYSGGADGARALLSTVAGSMVTVAGVGFSITIVALVLASTQFGPRLLTLFMRDLTSQVTLGTFAGTFIYCVLVLRSVRGVEEGGAPFIPAISITAAILLTLVSVAALVLFFHHVAVSIQAPKLVATVARDLDRAIDVLYPSALGRGGPEPDPDLVPSIQRDAVIAAAANGYLQVVDDAALLVLAERHDVVVRLLARPGLFLIRGNPVIVVRPAAAVDPDVAQALRSTLILGDVRTAEDDIEFSVRQLVEVALRALSPAINDPFTAMAAVDWLSGALARLATEDFPSRYRYDESGRLRVVADISTFPGIVHTIFSRIRHYGGDSPVVLNRLLEGVAGFGPHIRDESDRQQVRLEIEAVMETGRARIRSEVDLDELERRHQAALAALAAPTTEERETAAP